MLEVTPNINKLLIKRFYWWQAQLRGISKLIQRLEDLEMAEQEKPRELHKKQLREAAPSRFAVVEGDEWYRLVEDSIIIKSVNSAATVAVLAPFIETLFVAIFEELKAHQNLIPKVENHPDLEDYLKAFWDPHYPIKKGKRSEKPNFVEGVLQKIEICGLQKHLPKDLAQTLEILYRYRNNMMHNSFQWPEPQMKSFGELLEKSKCPEKWFELASILGRQIPEKKGSPIFYTMTNDFSIHCYELIEDIILGVDKYFQAQGIVIQEVDE